MTPRPRRSAALPLVLSGAVLAGTLAGTTAASAREDRFDADFPAQSARLVGHHVLPAATFGEPVPSGSAIEGANGVAVPFDAQPVQGFSGNLVQPDGSWLVLSDNGYGAKANSADFLLAVHRLQPAEDGSVELVPGGFTLSDPYRHVSWELTREDRRLTGADFDVESFRQAPDGTFWFGEEFGPYLLHTDAAGRLVEAPVPLPGVSSPDDPALGDAEPNLGGSKGFEGMAISSDGRYLFPMLEGPVAGDDPQDLRVLRYDTQQNRYRGEEFTYRLESPKNAIGDFTRVDDHRFLVLERDNGQGATAVFKAVFLVDTSRTDAAGHPLKTQLVNLMAVPDPDGVAPQLSAESGYVTFPFQTIESVDVVDEHTIVVGNDNNFPFSAGRTEGAPDDNEFLTIEVQADLG
ncbi:esterase-like activity of phytase family protein [Paenibacillus sp. TRM 82003]|uniref:esterase-like activity of phytase family protein n=1 Tax=Kineococcus sp. TRM81007 TaxID=2925831 RepID=UPI001F5A4613|nr:esterase-like activity of phytase family protein [Kineococcus sp. TRM81007]MCI2239345.1 esterase-like activity of phytase family protein [Kineococcus sp. TRM81007]MCI3925029.1 esterase-like activity of phytase family protein [Paenibacillus sp. TRM 82003]